MLKIYSGYHLADKIENITFDIHELQPQQEIIDIVTQFMTSSNALDDETLDVGISTTNPLVIATVEAIAMEKNVMHNLKYVYITEDGNEHVTNYMEDRSEGKYYPNNEYTDLKTRFYKAYYERKRKE
jgi:hypothetical protein